MCSWLVRSSHVLCGALNVMGLTDQIVVNLGASLWLWHDMTGLIDREHPLHTVLGPVRNRALV